MNVVIFIYLRHEKTPIHELVLQMPTLSHGWHFWAELRAGDSTQVSHVSGGSPKIYSSTIVSREARKGPETGVQLRYFSGEYKCQSL